MLKPSYAELMDVMNRDTEKDDAVTSRYSVVIAASKRARQLIAGDSPMISESDIDNDKPLSIAVKELSEGKIKVVPEGMGTVIHIDDKEASRHEVLADEIKKDLEQKLTSGGIIDATNSNSDFNSSGFSEESDSDEGLSVLGEDDL